MRPMTQMDTSPTRSDYRQWLLATAAVLAMGAGGSLATSLALAQAVTVVDVVTLAEGYRASALTGKAVRNAAGEEIGTIDDFIVDREKVLYTILQVGGFLGLGGYLIAVPYESLEITDNGRTITLTAGGSKEELQNMDEFTYSEPN